MDKVSKRVSYLRLVRKLKRAGKYSDECIAL